MVNYHCPVYGCLNCCRVGACQEYFVDCPSNHRQPEHPAKLSQSHISASRSTQESASGIWNCIQPCMSAADASATTGSSYNALCPVNTCCCYQVLLHMPPWPCTPRISYDGSGCACIGCMLTGLPANWFLRSFVVVYGGFRLLRHLVI